MTAKQRWMVDGVDLRWVYASAQELSVWKKHGISDAKDFFSKIKLAVSYKATKINGTYSHMKRTITIKPKQYGTLKRGMMLYPLCYLEKVMVHEMVHAAMKVPGSYNGNVSNPFILDAHGEEFKMLLLDATTEYFELDRDKVLQLYRTTPVRGKHGKAYSMDRAIETVLQKDRNLNMWLGSRVGG